MSIDSPSTYGVDLRAEAELLVPHDLTALHARLEGALRRRQLLTTLLAGAAVLGLAAGALTLATAPEKPPPPPPPPVAPIMAAAPVFVPVAAPVPCEPVPPIVRTVVVHAPAPAVAKVSTTDDDAPELEGSRLRAQLRIYDDGQRALVGGDPERALSRARHLRERYPNGPLDLDAAILAVRALRALGRSDEAREALGDVEKHALAPEKRAVLAELRLQMPAPMDVEVPRVIFQSLPRVVEGPTPFDGPAGPSGATAAEPVVEDPNAPSRVIGVP